MLVGETACVPDEALVPDQPLLPVQLVALVEDQVIVLDCPEVIVVGEALMVAVGAMRRVAEQPAVKPPFVPVHVQLYVEALVVTLEAVPATQRLALGGAKTDWPSAVPQVPSTGESTTVSAHPAGFVSDPSLVRVIVLLPADPAVYRNVPVRLASERMMVVGEKVPPPITTGVTVISRVKTPLPLTVKLLETTPVVSVVGPASRRAVAGITALSA